jgi:hypothetical protein
MTYGTAEIIQTVTVGAGGAANIEFTNIPQTYNDLKLVLSARTTAAVAYENIQLQFNNSGGTAYSDRIVFSNSQNALSASNTGQANTFFQYAVSSTATSSTFSSVDFYIPNYAGSTNKSISVDSVAENNSSTTAFLGLASELWANTAAITSIKLTPNTGGSTFVQHSTATLYGITRVPAGAKATGGVIYDDASYWYHVFTSSGTFTPSQSITADVLVVAGGAGGGAACGGGGGAGGVLEHTSQSITTQNYTVLVGAGGPGGTLINRGTNGQDSQFGSLTASVGGGNGGAGGNPTEGKQVGGNGGSGGGGGGGFSGATAAGGTAQSGQGNNGGTSNNSGPGFAGGGGGGKGGTGAQGTSTIGGTGGAGSNAWSSWLSVVGLGVNGFIAGGGGGGIDQTGNTGGTAGSGGAGAGGKGGVAGSSAVMHTGSGGGGGGDTSATVGGSGASGFVIVRYAK